MPPVPLQIILTAAACGGLFFAWRAAVRGDRRAGLIVTGGFLLRALAGQALFWISWLGLPVARSMQYGRGFWFFAADGPGYLTYAELLARRELHAAYPSASFVQLLAVFVWLFGAVASVAILLNCAAYLATCAIVMRVARGRTGAPLLACLAAISFGPSVVLWSLQPLKDTLFTLLAIAFFAASLWWKNAGDARARIASSVALAVLLLLLASQRWYFAVALFCAWGVFALWVTLTSRRKWRTLAHAAAAVILLGVAAVFGMRKDMPHVPWRVSPVEQVAQTRKQFAKQPGATTIAPGRALDTVAAPPPAPQPAPVPQPTPPPKPKKHRPKPPAPAPAPQSAPQPVPAPSVATPAPAAAPTPAAPAPPDDARASFVAQLAATFLPRFVAQSVGLMRVGGGRGLWLFVDFDTLVFDAVVIFAVIWLVRSRGRLNGLAVMVLLVFVLTAGPMIYVVNNFGTLFRLRDMLYVLAALLPVTIAREGAGGVGGEGEKRSALP